ADAHRPDRAGLLHQHPRVGRLPAVAALPGRGHVLDAADAGRLHARAALLRAGHRHDRPQGVTAGRERVRLDAPPAVVPRFEPLELTLRLAAPAFDNPFAEAVPTGRFVAPSGRALEVGGFCDADDGGVL